MDSECTRADGAETGTLLLRSELRDGIRGRHADDLYGLQMGLVSNTMTDDQAIEDMAPTSQPSKTHNGPRLEIVRRI